jgi:hypothetical protein
MGRGFWEGGVDPSNGSGSTLSTRTPTSGLQQFGSNSFRESF